jgi:Carboxypeptidase regulatory-like domain
MKPLRAILCAVVAMASFVLGAELSSSGTLAGAVLDSEGAVISDATVLVHWDTDGSQGRRRDGPPDLHLVTGKTGQFSANLAAGFYDVAVFAHAFSPSAHKVRIRVGKTTNYEVKLAVDPQISAEVGGTLVESSDTPSRKPKQ